MLRVGLSGGIGSGKSTVARRLAEHGAVVIDADVLAREVVAPGSEGLAELVAHFGPDILDADGGLDRPAMAARVFGDDDARAQLNSIVHPRIGSRTAELMAQAPQDGIVVHDIPLLVEAGYGAHYHLVIIVDAPVEDRVKRLIDRGLEEPDARARIQAQASDEQRREAADVWLDNSGAVEDVVAAVDHLWHERLVPFEAHERLRTGPERGPAKLIDPDPEWPREARRVIARIRQAAGDQARRVDHIGSTSVPGLAAKDVVDVQLSVGSWADAEDVTERLADAGFPPQPNLDHDVPQPTDPDPEQWRKRTHVSADPGRAVNLHVRVEGRANWRFGLLLPAWLRADAQARADYEKIKRDAATWLADDSDSDRYTEVKQPWFTEALPRAEKWAEESGWTP